MVEDSSKIPVDNEKDGIVRSCARSTKLLMWSCFLAVRRQLSYSFDLAVDQMAVVLSWYQTSGE